MKPLDIFKAQPEQMPALWPHVEGYFRSFEERSHGEIVAGDLLHAVMLGKKQCWVATNGEEIKACALTELMAGRMNVAILAFCAGVDREEWHREVVSEIEEWARANGAERVRIICRPGWAPELKKLGFKESHRVLERDL